jgi:hypothetical protein
MAKFWELPQPCHPGEGEASAPDCFTYGGLAIFAPNLSKKSTIRMAYLNLAARTAIICHLLLTWFLRRNIAPKNQRPLIS